MGSPDTANNSSTASHVDKGTGSIKKPLLRACDCCRKRKVRCDGGSPCGPCTKASISCAYLQPPKKKGPKGLRSARVLHALRRIDEHQSGSPVSPLSPEAGAFGNWGWSQPNMSLAGVQYGSNMQQQEPVYGPHTSVPPEQTYLQQHMPTSMPRATVPSMMYTSDTSSQGWSAQPTESLAEESDIPHIMSPPLSEPVQLRHPAENFYPYIRLFFDHMFDIMPVVDESIYGDVNFYRDSNAWSSELYCFISAICAAVIVQLQAKDVTLPAAPVPSRSTDGYFAGECLRERKIFDYIQKPTTLSVMTSFFLFAYYGNHENHTKAWHYLQETISFAENLDMDDEKTYKKLEPMEAQWTRRLYWLLFITERAYAIQRQKHARLPHNVTQPSVFPNEPPELLNGFNNLGKLFAAIDDNFVQAWRGSRKASLCNEAWLAQTQEQIDRVAFDLLGAGTETQQMDINVTREWLHVLAWQTGIKNGVVLWDQKEGRMGWGYPIELAKKVVEIIAGNANEDALDSHGIGMEQKLSDIASCLADVLKTTTDNTTLKWREGKGYLTVLLRKLQSIRGGESRYLQPLLDRMQGLMSSDFLTGQDLRAEIPLPDYTGYGMPHGAGMGMGVGVAPGFEFMEEGMTMGLGIGMGFGVTPATYDGAHVYQATVGKTEDAWLPTGLANGYNGRLSAGQGVADSFGMLRQLSMSGNTFNVPATGWLGAGYGLEEDKEQRRPSGFVEQEIVDSAVTSAPDWVPWLGRTATAI